MRNFIQIADDFCHRLTEMTLPTRIEDAIDRLSQAGYKVLGSPGRYGTVLRKPGATYCVKLFSVADKAYLSYLHLVRTVSNEHFPKIIGKPVPIKRKPTTDDSPDALLAQMRSMTFNADDTGSTGYPLYYAVKMEPLEQRSGAAFDWSEIMFAYVDGDTSITEKYPTLTTAIDLIRQTTYRRLDLAPRNILFRGDVPVLIDPIV